MSPTPGRWTVFDPDARILTFEYSFGPGMATSLAAGCDAGLVIVSPPCRVGADVLDEVERFGPVCALVASNAFHHMGLPRWKQRFAQAALFAPAQSIARVRRQSGLQDIRPLAEAEALTGPRLALLDMPHYRTGEALVRIDTARGRVWYVTDVILNMPVLPGHPLPRLLFKLSGSAPGLRYNNIAPLFMVRDKAALRRWIALEAAERPPRWLIPAHGNVVDFQADPDAARALFGAA